MKIGELSKQTGLPPSTLRYYESIGLLPTAKRESGQRVYDKSVLKRLRLVRAAKGTNFSLEEIARFLSSRETDWRPLAEAKLRELEGVIESYQEVMDALTRLLEHGCLDE